MNFLPEDSLGDVFIFGGAYYRENFGYSLPTPFNGFEPIRTNYFPIDELGEVLVLGSAYYDYDLGFLFPLPTGVIPSVESGNAFFMFMM